MSDGWFWATIFLYAIGALKSAALLLDRRPHSALRTFMFVALWPVCWPIALLRVLLEMVCEKIDA